MQITIEQLLAVLDELEESWHNTTVEDEATQDKEDREELSKHLRTFLKMMYTPLQIAVYTNEDGVKGVILNRLPNHPVDIVEFRYAKEYPIEEGEATVRLTQPEEGEATAYVKRHKISYPSIAISTLVDAAPALPTPYETGETK